MDFINFAINFLVDEVSGDSEFDSVGAAAAVAGLGAREGALHGECGSIDDDDDRESVVDGGSDTDGGEDGRDDGKKVGDSNRDDDDGDGDVEGSMGWWSPSEVDHKFEPMKEEGDERRISTDRVEDARERDRRFWETCLESGYP